MVFEVYIRHYPSIDCQCMAIADSGLKTVFEFIESNPNHFDASKIWAEGFSQNSVFSAYLGFCFSDKVLGISQGGSGLAITGQKPYFPGCEGQVSTSDHEECHSDCETCIKTHPCNYYLLFH